MIPDDPCDAARLAATIERRLAFERKRDALIDADIAVDDVRRELEGVLVRLRSAVSTRDVIARDLSVAIAALEHAA